ncbi:unnamed protein product [Caenorhabditis nigoni]
MLHASKIAKKTAWNEMVARNIPNRFPSLTENSIGLNKESLYVEIAYEDESTEDILPSVCHSLTVVAYLVDHIVPYDMLVENYNQTILYSENRDPPKAGDILKLEVFFPINGSSYQFKVVYVRKNEEKCLVGGSSKIRLVAKPVMDAKDAPKDPDSMSVERTSAQQAEPAESYELKMDQQMSVRPFQQFMLVGVKDEKPRKKNELTRMLHRINANATNIIHAPLLLNKSDQYVYFFNGRAPEDDAKIEAALFKEEGWERLFSLNTPIVEPFFAKSLSVADLLKHMLVATRLDSSSIFQTNRLEIVNKEEELRASLMDSDTVNMILEKLSNRGVGVFRQFQSELNIIEIE